MKNQEDNEINTERNFGGFFTMRVSFCNCSVVSLKGRQIRVLVIEG